MFDYKIFNLAIRVGEYNYLICLLIYIMFFYDFDPIQENNHAEQIQGHQIGQAEG